MANLSVTARNDAGDSIVSLLDAGSAQASGYIEIRTGTIPSSPQAVASGSVLATLAMSNPAWGNFINGSGSANPITPATGITTSGKATWFRAYNRDGVAVIDGSISTIGGGGDLQFDSVDFLEGGTIQISSMVATVPE